MFVKFLLREIRWFFGRSLPSSQNVRRRMGKREEIPPPAVRIFRVGKRAVHSRGVVNRIRHVFFFGGNRRAAGGVFFGEEVSRKGRKIEMGMAASHQKNFFNTHTQITPLKTATKKEAFFQHTREECFPTIPPRNRDETPRRTPRNRTFFNMRVHVYFFTLEKCSVSWVSSGVPSRSRGGFAPVSVGRRSVNTQTAPTKPRKNPEANHDPFFNVRFHVYFFMFKKGWVS